MPRPKNTAAMHMVVNVRQNMMLTNVKPMSSSEALCSTSEFTLGILAMNPAPSLPIMFVTPAYNRQDKLVKFATLVTYNFLV